MLSTQRHYSAVKQQLKHLVSGWVFSFMPWVLQRLQYCCTFTWPHKTKSFGKSSCYRMGTTYQGVLKEILLWGRHWLWLWEGKNSNYPSCRGVVFIPGANTGTWSIAGLSRRAAEENTEPLMVYWTQAIHLVERKQLIHWLQTPSFTYNCCWQNSILVILFKDKSVFSFCTDEVGIISQPDVNLYYVLLLTAIFRTT